MTERQDDRDIEMALSAWMGEVAPSRPPTRILEQTFAETMRTRQLRAFPWSRSVGLGRLDRQVTLSRRVVLLATIALLVALVAAVGIAGGGARPAVAPVPAATPTVAPSVTPTPLPTLPAAIPVTPETVIPVQGVMALAARGPAIWVMAPGRVSMIDTGTDAVGDAVTIGSTTDLYNGLAANDAGVWATNATTAELDRVDPVTAKVVQIPVGLSPKGVLATAGGVWVADVHGGSVFPIDQASNKVGTAIVVGPTGASGPNWLGSGLGSLWVGVPNNSTIVRFAPVTGRIEATIDAPQGTTPCGGFAVGATAVWIPSCSSTTTMARIDPTSNTAGVKIEMGGYAFNPTLIGGVPWLSLDRGTADSGLLVRLDPATNAIDRVLLPGATFGGGGDIVVADGSVWVSDGWNNAVLRLPLAAFTPGG